MMMTLLVLAHAMALHSDPRSVGADSVVVERLGASRPRYFPLTKRNTIKASQGVTEAVSQLRAARFFELDGDSLAAACGHSATVTVNRLAITVFSGAEARQLVIADDCVPAAPDHAAADRAATVAELRSLAWRLLRPNARRPPGR